MPRDYIDPDFDQANRQASWDFVPDEPAPRRGPAVYGVGEITSYLRDLLETDPVVGDVWIAGEVRNLTRSQAGHVYFTLTDERGALKCAFFRRENIGVRVDPGDDVLVHGRVSIYPQRGELQLYVDALQPQGMGVLHAEYLRLLERLKEEGLFAPERKRALPKYPRRIAVVTSPGGAVWHDIQTVLARRWPLAALQLAPCRVQGDGAARTIANCLATLNRQPASRAADVIILGRGGGSLEDLWPFNEEAVARAIFASAIPVVSAVGHETDTTIADYVADVRAPTPSAAAEIVAPDRDEERARIRDLERTLGRGLERWAATARGRVDVLNRRLAHAAPDIRHQRADVNRHLHVVEAETRRLVGARFGALASLRGRLAGLDPTATLSRGYAIVQDGGGQVVTRAGSLRRGDTLSLRFADGTAEAEVTDTQPG